MFAFQKMFIFYKTKKNKIEATSGKLHNIEIVLLWNGKVSMDSKNKSSFMSCILEQLFIHEHEIKKKNRVWAQNLGVINLVV
jgi:hypothetical protein